MPDARLIPDGDALGILVANRHGPQPYDKPLERAIHTLLSELREGDPLHQATIIEHRDRAGRDLSDPERVKAAEASIRGMEIAPVRVIVVHDDRCAPNMSWGRCRCTDVRVDIVRPERAP